LGCGGYLGLGVNRAELDEDGERATKARRAWGRAGVPRGSLPSSAVAGTTDDLPVAAKESSRFSNVEAQ